MEQLSIQELEDGDALDELVSRCGTIDQFCSSSAWILPAHRQLMPPRDPWIFQSEAGMAVLAQGEHAKVGRYLQPLEAAWSFASPLVSADPHELVSELVDLLLARAEQWDTLLLGGLLVGSPELDALIAALRGRCQLWLGRETIRHHASLVGGVEAFLARRKSKFRANLRRSERLAVAQGVTYERVTECGTAADRRVLYARILDLEARSWKGPEDAGITGDSMRRFYEDMFGVLGPRRRLRVVFARRDGEDVAYVFGVVLGRTYRGLQLSYDDRYRHLSLGNLVQLEMIRLLAAEGIALYDMGCDLDYKRRWAESKLVSVTLGAFSPHFDPDRPGR